jgi:hypothetical protein
MTDLRNRKAPAGPSTAVDASVSRCRKIVGNPQPILDTPDKINLRSKRKIPVTKPGFFMTTDSS